MTTGLPNICANVFEAAGKGSCMCQRRLLAAMRRTSTHPELLNTGRCQRRVNADP